MSTHARNTVDRLDRPSAYYQGRVSYIWQIGIDAYVFEQKKKRTQDQEGDDKEKDTAVEDIDDDPLKNAATLYVGNLWVAVIVRGVHAKSNQIFLHNRRADSRALFKMW